MATCSNCVRNGVTTTQGTPGAQFGMFYNYPSTCPGGCLIFTNTGYRCSNDFIMPFGATSSGCGCARGCTSCWNR